MNQSRKTKRLIGRNEESSSAAEPGWKDELNLAEFPIAALTDRIPDGQTTSGF